MLKALKLIKYILPIFLLLGCGSSAKNTKAIKEPIVETVVETVYIDRNITVVAEASMCTVVDYDSAFTGRIVYEDGTPYKRGVVKASGITWQSFAMTDDNGNYSVQVKGDDRFIFSAGSPFGDFIFYSYENPLLVPAGEVSEAYDCTYDIEIIMCIENNILRG